jgi:Family of unknown function (DUF6188)
VIRPTFTDTGESWTLPLADLLVNQCIYDFAFTMGVSDVEPFFSITIESAFTIRWASGSVGQFDPGGDPAQMGGTLALLRLRVQNARAYKDGHLEIDIEGGIHVDVPPGDGYEPWNMTGPDGIRMVSTGGELVIWS